MNRRTPEEARRIPESLGPDEKLVKLIINFPDHLWHNRPGVVRNGKWKAATRKEIEEHKKDGRLRIGEVLSLPGVVTMNRTLSFGNHTHLDQASSRFGNSSEGSCELADS